MAHKCEHGVHTRGGGKKKHLNFIQRPKLSKTMQFSAVADTVFIRLKLKIKYL